MIDTIYNKCQRLALEAAKSDLESVRGHGNVNPFISFRAATWVVAYEHFRKGKISEETIKYWFHLGFVPEYTDAYDEAGKMARRGIGPYAPRRKKFMNWAWEE